MKTRMRAQTISTLDQCHKCTEGNTTDGKKSESPCNFGKKKHKGEKKRLSFPTN